MLAIITKKGTSKELQVHELQSVAYHLRCLNRAVQDHRRTSTRTPLISMYDVSRAPFEETVRTACAGATGTLVSYSDQVLSCMISLNIQSSYTHRRIYQIHAYIPI